MKNKVFNGIKQFFLRIVATRFNHKCLLLNRKQIKSDEFDSKYGFILKYGIDNKENYLKVKNHYFRNLSASVKDNVRCSVKGLL